MTALHALPTTKPADIAAEWKTTLLRQGVCDADCAIIQQILMRYAFDSRRLTAVYRMDDAELDRLLPLEVLPQPTKITRVALVIVQNVDPSAGSDLDDLIVQLADPSWRKRQDAFDALKKAGPTAIPKLEAASHSKDLEVVWRAEKLLSILRQKP